MIGRTPVRGSRLAVVVAAAFAAVALACGGAPRATPEISATARAPAGPEARDAAASDEAAPRAPAPTAEGDAGVASASDAGAPDGAMRAAIAVSIPGPCVSPRLHAAQLAAAAGPRAFVAEDDSALDAHPDLDGDGVDDLAIFAGATDITSTRYLYVRRGGCGHYVGTIVTDAGLGESDDAVSHGLRDLVGDTVCRTSCCAKSTRHVWRFDGKRYRLVSKTPVTRSCDESLF